MTFSTASPAEVKESIKNQHTARKHLIGKLKACGDPCMQGLVKRHTELAEKEEHRQRIVKFEADLADKKVRYRRIAELRAEHVAENLDSIDWNRVKSARHY